jgi:hypothetical protein
MKRPPTFEGPEGPPRLDRPQALQAVADALGGTFGKAQVTGGYVVTVEHGVWTLTLDLHVVTVATATQVHTRVSVLFLGREDLRFTVRRRSFIDALAAKVGLRGLPIGVRELARRYVVKGRPETLVRSILSGGLANALAVPGTFRVEVRRAPRRHRKALGPRARQLQVLFGGVDTDVGRMTGMFALARETLDVLQRVGAASSEPTR